MAGKKGNRFERSPVLTIFMIVVGFFALVEAAGHIAYLAKHGVPLWHSKPAGRYDPYSLVRQPPNTPMSDGPEKLTTDMHGFVHNGYVRDIREDKDKLLIFMLGGSTVVGFGASGNGKTLPAQLERALNEKLSKNVRVVNAGSSGYVAYQELGLLAGPILQSFEPDMVLAVDGRNDAATAAGYRDWRPNWQPHYSSLEKDVNAMMRPSPWAGLAYWAPRVSAAAKLFMSIRYRLYRTGEVVWDREGPAPESLLRRAADAYFSTHAAARARCRALGIPYFAFLQPTVTRGLKKDVTGMERSSVDEFIGRQKSTRDIYDEGMDGFYALASKRAAEAPWFHDLSRFFLDSKGGVYADSCHYTDKGNKMLADRMAELLLPEVRKALGLKRRGASGS